MYIYVYISVYKISLNEHDTVCFCFILFITQMLLKNNILYGLQKYFVANFHILFDGIHFTFLIYG